MLRKRVILVFAFIGTFVKMLQMFLYDVADIKYIILIEANCLLITPMAVAFLLHKLLKRIELVEEYLILLQTVSIQIRYQDR